MKTQKDLDHYLALDYPIELIRDSEQGGYFARHPDLLGCTAEGSTPEEAVRNLDESRELWLEARLDSGHPVPEPVSDEYAGRISLRTSPSLHAFLVLSEWASGISVKDKVVEEIRSLLAETVDKSVKAETKSPIRRGRAA
jgi:antitoxin HicB